MTHHTDNILNSAEEDFVKSKLYESCLTNWTEIYHRSTAHVWPSNGAKIFNFRKVDFFDVFKYLIVIIRQSDMESKYWNIYEVSVPSWKRDFLKGHVSTVDTFSKKGITIFDFGFKFSVKIHIRKSVFMGSFIIEIGQGSHNFPKTTKIGRFFPERGVFPERVNMVLGN